VVAQFESRWQAAGRARDDLLAAMLLAREIKEKGRKEENAKSISKNSCILDELTKKKKTKKTHPT